VLSASALVVGVMCLVFGAALNPAEAGEGMVSAVRVASEQSGRWLAMAVLYFCASVALTCGMPAVLSLFRERAHRLGMTAVAVLSVGAIGTCGFAMLLVFIQALAQEDALRTGGLDAVINDDGLAVFLWGWVGGFYLGALLVAVALLVSRSTPAWVPALLLLFVLLLPGARLVGQTGQVVGLMALAVAFTGIAIAAVGQSQRPDVLVT
jgi:hypothetical protein